MSRSTAIFYIWEMTRNEYDNIFHPVRLNDSSLWCQKLMCLLGILHVFFSTCTVGDLCLQLKRHVQQRKNKWNWRHRSRPCWYRLPCAKSRDNVRWRCLLLVSFWVFLILFNSLNKVFTQLSITAYSPLCCRHEEMENNTGVQTHHKLTFKSGCMGFWIQNPTV